MIVYAHQIINDIGDKIGNAPHVSRTAKHV
jgi:hypothetical protein